MWVAPAISYGPVGTPPIRGCLLLQNFGIMLFGEVGRARSRARARAPHRTPALHEERPAHDISCTHSASQPSCVLSALHSEPTVITIHYHRRVRRSQLKPPALASQSPAERPYARPAAASHAAAVGAAARLGHPRVHQTSENRRSSNTIRSRRKPPAAASSPCEPAPRSAPGRDSP